MPQRTLLHQHGHEVGAQVRVILPLGQKLLIEANRLVVAAQPVRQVSLDDARTE
jgi:hypothetical protein